MSNNATGGGDSLVLEVTVVENTLDEDAQSFKQYITEMFYGPYDEVECVVQVESDQP